MRITRKGIGLGATAGTATIAATIQQVEGYYPGTLAYTNNNPGNLIYVGQAGATQGTGGFAAFPTYDAGYNALLNQIQNYANRGLTIDQMMNIYAPASQAGNNPTLYAQKIADSLGVSTGTTVADAISGNSTTGVDLTGAGAVDASVDDSGDNTILGMDPTTVLVAAAAIAAALYLY